MFYRHFFAIIYDTILVFSLIFTCIGLGVLINIEGKIVFWIITLPASYFYFVFSWVNGGQTLGMKSWKIKLEKISYKDATLRFFLALLSIMAFGIGFFYKLTNKNHQTLYDTILKTKIIDLKKIKP